MKILIIGAGGVGTSMATIIKRAGDGANWATKIVMADYNFDRAKEVAEHICGGGRFVAEKINAYGDRLGQVVVTGYTDRLGDDMYNINLSLLRAQTVRAYLVSRGVDPNSIIAVGNGKFTPTKECSDNQNRSALVDCLQPNRRVEVSVSFFE